jgi:hypothetical protein
MKNTLLLSFFLSLAKWENEWKREEELIKEREEGWD